MAETSIFDPDGIAVPYVAEGDDGPTLVLIPGQGMDGGALGTVAHILAEEGFTVLRVGSRRTPAEDPSAAIAERVGDVVAVMDHVGMADAWVGGHALGGTVARALAAEHVDRVGGVLLLGVEDVDVAKAPAIPVLVIQGDADDVTPPANGEALQAAQPGLVTLTSVPGAGHLFPMTHPIETTEIIEDYLDWD